MVILKQVQGGYLRLLFAFRRAHQFLFGRVLFLPFPRSERVNADNLQAGIVFFSFLVKAFVLYFPALVHRVHRSKHSATLRNTLKLSAPGLLNQLRQFFYDE